MAVTLTRAPERDARTVRRRQSRPGLADAVLVAVSLASLVVVWAAYLGRTFLVERHRRGAPAVANLNTAQDAAALEPALQAAFPHSADRAFAAREIFAVLAPADGRRRTLANVGALTRLEVSAAAIERDPALEAYRERLRAARDRRAQGASVTSVPLLTPADVSAVKPALVVRDVSAVRAALLAWLALCVAAFHGVSLFWRARGLRGDRFLLAAAHLLVGVGFAVMVGRMDPLRDTMLFVRYAQGVVLGLAAMAAVSAAGGRIGLFRDLSYLPLLAALVLSLVLLAFGSGPGGSSAKVNLGPVQPIEAIRLLIVLFLAAYLGRRWELLRGVRSETFRGRHLPPWLRVPRLEHVLPLIAGVGLALVLFFLQRDLGPALVISIVFLTLYAVARGGPVLTVAGFVLLTAGFYAGYALGLSETLADRVRMWRSPWDNAARGGDQIAQALWGAATGGRWGTGLGLGDTRYLPAGHTDLVLAGVAEELGFVGLVAVGLVYAAIVWRGFQTARRASSDYTFFLAVGLTLLIAVPAALMLAGLLGIVPLTGVVTPFLSYGGSAMLANFAALGALAAVRSDTRRPADLAPFARPLRWSGGVLGACAVALALVLVRVQIVRADDLAVRPHLGVQADGSRRYQYNPRILDVAREIQRGRVLDRRGLPLAVESPEHARRARGEYERAGISNVDPCPADGTRCYPLGGRAFHILGDAGTRLNWGASNTAFVEREAEAKLRGFDDHQTPVRTVGADGSPAWALRRDYRELLPLLRYRYRPSHASVRAVLARPRDVRTTLDAALQVRTAAILADHARRSASGRAAAVVIEPETGHLLASVSYPWPEEDPESTAPSPREDLLDRARFGLYPPGSTFKVLTAAAALRRDPRLRDATFTCSRLPDGRNGARISGWGRPVRDDVLDHTPHGRLGMHEALAVSCNAYFAQLAVRIGPEALLDVARPVGVSLARGNTAGHTREALPQVGYGQGEVLATPLRMARVAAAVAAGGVLREVEWETGTQGEGHEVLFGRDTARLLGRYMRDVVLTGTGRSLRNHPVPIAGKTGTAEVASAASHSWFIGFAPYGEASRRVAVAVIIENAGYGAAAAVPAAGEIVSAAASLGLVR